MEMKAVQEGSHLVQSQVEGKHREGKGEAFTTHLNGSWQMQMAVEQGTQKPHQGGRR